MKNSSRGFTLLETLVAVSILAIAIAGPLFIANRAVVVAQAARDELTASYLAQEGIEYVRMMRDDEFLSFYRAGGSNVTAAAWNDFISGGSTASIGGCKITACTLDPGRSMGTGGGFSLTPCSGNACTPLYLNGNTYTQLSNGTITPFTRTIQAVDVNASEEQMISKVTWVFHGLTYSVSVSDHLTEWQ